MINLGNIEIADLRLGASQVKAVYFGSEQVWSGGDEPLVPIVNALRFTAEQPNSTVRLDKVGAPYDIQLQYSTNGIDRVDYSWNSGTGNQITLANVGDYVMIFAKNENQNISKDWENYYKFVMTGKIAASGNVQTLFKADSTVSTTTSNCYRNLFSDCSALTYAPELPASVITNACYFNMFKNCIALSSQPELSAVNTIADSAFYSMFNGCTSLQKATPPLLSHKMASSTYQSMYENCSSLTDAKVTVYTGNQRQASMFKNCTSLSCVEWVDNYWSPYTDWPGQNGTINWLQNVAASGMFICPARLADIRGPSNIPEGWTKVDAA